MRTFLGLLSVAAVCTALHVPTASACDVSLEPVYATFPADGGTLPADSVLVVYGYRPELDDVTATIDGQPATMSKAWDSSGITGFAIHGATEGSVVEINGSFCHPKWHAGFRCDSHGLALTIGSADTVAPPPVSDLQVAMRYEPSDNVGSCDGVSDHVIDFSFADAGDGGPAHAWHELELDDPQNDEGWRFVGLYEVGAGAREYTTRLVLGDFNRDVCFRMRTRDAAGFEALSDSVCVAAGEPTVGGTGAASTTSPSDSSGDGGSESSSGDETGEPPMADGEPRGCACRAGPEPTGGALGALLFIVAGWRRRRHDRVC